MAKINDQFKIGSLYKTTNGVGLTKFWPIEIFEANSKQEAIKWGAKTSFGFNTFEDDTFLVLDKNILDGDWIMLKVLVLMNNQMFTITPSNKNHDIRYVKLTS